MGVRDRVHFGMRELRTGNREKRRERESDGCALLCRGGELYYRWVGMD